MPNGKTPKELGYETQDVGWKLPLWSFAGLIALALVVIVLRLFTVRGFSAMPDFSEVPKPVATAEPRPIPDGPLLQALPPVDMAEYKASAMSHLNSYGWVDEAAGKTHIPIERAMEIALEQGFATGIPEPAPSEESEDDGDAAAEATEPEGEDAP